MLRHRAAPYLSVSNIAPDSMKLFCMSITITAQCSGSIVKQSGPNAREDRDSLFAVDDGDALHLY